MSNTGVEYVLSLKDKFTSPIKKATDSTERLNKAVQNTQNGFNKIGSALGIGISVAGVVSFGKAVVDSLVNYEYFSASIRALMKGNAGAAKALESQLVSLAAKTPFSLVEVQDASKQLLAYGFAAGDVTKNITMLGDVASGLKIPFSDIAYLYGTLKTQGRAYTRDILQFQQRGIPVVKELAKQFGVADDKVSELVKDGKVGFADVEKAFKSMTSEGGMFFEMMKQQTNTVGGQISAMGDNWEQLKVAIGQSQSGIISGTISYINKIIELKKNQYQAENIIDSFYKDKKGGFSFFEKNVESLKDNINSFFGIEEGKGDYKKATNFVQESVSRFSPKNELEAHKNLATLWSYVAENLKMQKTSGGTRDLLLRKKVYDYLIQQNKNALSLFSLKGEKEKPTGETTGGSSLSSVETSKPNNFNISIDKLVEHLEFHTENLKESSNQIKAEVVKALIGAVNDFQLMATK